jgi:hypothetical protein
MSASDPSLALQEMLRARLIADAATTALVPATSILDKNHRPEQSPAVIIGEGHGIFADNFSRFYDQAFADVHIWVQEDGLQTGKAIAGAVKAALRDGPWSVNGYRVVNMRGMQARYMRDPDGKHSHVVLSVAAILIEDTSTSMDSFDDPGMDFSDDDDSGYVALLDDI